MICLGYLGVFDFDISSTTPGQDVQSGHLIFYLKRRDIFSFLLHAIPELSISQNILQKRRQEP